MHLPNLQKSSTIRLINSNKGNELHSRNMLEVSGRFTLKDYGIARLMKSFLLLL